MDRVLFTSTADAVVQELAGLAPELSWVVATHEGDMWVPIATYDPTYSPLFEIPWPWHHTHSSRMASGEGPRVAPRTEEIPVYKAAPSNRELTVRSFIGAPVEAADGRVPAVVCGWSPREQEDSFADLLPAVEARAAQLAVVLPLPIWDF